MKEFRYKEYLSKYSDCPPKDFVEKNFECFRWVHNPITEDDFLPVPLCTPPRKLTNSDIDCKLFSISLWKDLLTARMRYKEVYENIPRKEKADEFIKLKGNLIAKLYLTNNDGVAESPNISGHISFYDYTSCNFLEKVKDRFDIFV